MRRFGVLVAIILSLHPVFYARGGDDPSDALKKLQREIKAYKAQQVPCKFAEQGVIVRDFKVLEKIEAAASKNDTETIKHMAQVERTAMAMPAGQLAIIVAQTDRPGIVWVIFPEPHEKVLSGRWLVSTDVLQRR